MIAGPPLNGASAGPITVGTPLFSGDAVALPFTLGAPIGLAFESLLGMLLLLPFAALAAAAVVVV